MCYKGHRLGCVQCEQFSSLKRSSQSVFWMPKLHEHINYEINCKLVSWLELGLKNTHRDDLMLSLALFESQTTVSQTMMDSRIYHLSIAGVLFFGVHKVSIDVVGDLLDVRFVHSTKLPEILR